MGKKKKYLLGRLWGKQLTAPLVLTIAFVAYGREAWIVFFEEIRRGVVLHKTLRMQLAQIGGSDSVRNWKGLKVELYTIEKDKSGHKSIRARSIENLSLPYRVTSL